MNLTGKSLIGAEVSAGRPGAFRAVNPATGEALDPAYDEAGPTEGVQA